MPVPGYLKFAPRVFWKKNALPHYLVFFVTRRCTAKCGHCLLGDRCFSERELSLEEIESFSRNMDPLLFLLITGGDPFIRKDLPDIIKTFYRNPGFRNLGMPSNGYLTDKIADDVESILVDCPNIDFAVDISIDGIGESHDRIRGVPGLFDRAMETYRKLEILQNRFDNFNLNVAVTVSAFNHMKLESLYTFLKTELKVKTINHLLCRGNPRDPDALQVDMDKYSDFSDMLDEDMKKDILTGYKGYPFADLVNGMKMIRQKVIRQTAEEGRPVVPCYAARLGAVVYPNGDVMACELRDDKLGNLREMDYRFNEIVRSARAESIRRKITDENCHCTYECFLTNGVMFTPRLTMSVVWESLKLKFQRLLFRGNNDAS